MRQINRQALAALLKEKRVRTRLIKDLRFAPELIEDWADLEMLAVATRSGQEGVLLIEPDGSLHVLPYELSTRTADNSTGRSKPITCDFCYTWQQDGKSGRVTFTRLSDDHKFTYLCCGDLRCSLHVRNRTHESLLSRTQLHEDISPGGRVARLHTKLAPLVQEFAV